MKIGQSNPATTHHIELQRQTAKIMQDKRIIDTLEANRIVENQRKVKECDKGRIIDQMV